MVARIYPVTIYVIWQLLISFITNCFPTMIFILLVKRVFIVAFFGLMKFICMA